MTSIAPGAGDGPTTQTGVSPLPEAENTDALNAFIAQFGGEQIAPENSAVVIDGEELLPPPELPAEYLDTARTSLVDTSAYSAHLDEHWGF